MPIVLLLLGLVVFVAGIMLAVPGVTFRDGAPDTEIITPGVIAAIGGLLLIGMGLVVRLLQRIERALAARSAATRAGDEVVAAAVTEMPGASVRIPFPPKPQSNPQPQPVSAAKEAVLEAKEDAALESLRVKFPNLARLGSAELVEGAAVSLMPEPPVRPEQEVRAAKITATPAPEPPRPEQEARDVKSPMVVGRSGNGASPARVAPRFDLKSRPAVFPAGAKGPVFKAAAAVLRDGERAAQAAVPLSAPTEPVHETAIDTRSAAQAPQAASVLKSGVVEGMAYTLYSDGSIEAQLPQGTLRFGSITALRDHLESAS